MRILSSLLLLFLVPIVHADEIQLSSGPIGIIADEGETGQFTLNGPRLSFPHTDGTKGNTTLKPVFSPAAGGLTGAITYKDAPDGTKIEYAISQKDNTVTFSLVNVPANMATIDFDMAFLTSQFFGGLYRMGDKPAVSLPIDLLPKAEFTRDSSFSIAGRDGIGLTIKTSGGTESFADDRKYNSYRYVWRYTHRLAAGEKQITLSFNALKTTPPKVALKPEGPPADGKWEPIPELTDEFNGDKLDETKWFDHNPGWAGRSPSFFAANNVRVADGKLQLLARLQDTPEALKKYPNFKRFSTAAVVAKTPSLYGYYEVRAKTMHIKVDNAFWFFTELPTPANLKKHVGELDVFEIDCGGDRFQRILFNTMHVWESDTVKQGKPMSKAVEFRMPTNPWDDYHLYAIDWEPDQLRCYYDGYLFSRYDNNDWHYPQKLQFDAEIQPEWFGTPKPEEFSSTFYVDYVRAWRRLDLPATPNP